MMSSSEFLESECSFKTAIFEKEGVSDDTCKMLVLLKVGMYNLCIKTRAGMTPYEVGMELFSALSLNILNFM